MQNVLQLGLAQMSLTGATRVAQCSSLTISSTSTMPMQASRNCDIHTESHLARLMGRAATGFPSQAPNPSEPSAIKPFPHLLSGIPPPPRPQRLMASPLSSSPSLHHDSR